jgi:outer membrane protein assembly factor BamE
MTQTAAAHYRLATGIALLLACLAAGCVYRMDIQQGNALEADAVEQIEVGMSQSAVQFLLGTPMLADPFHADRWDYPYYLLRGRSDEAQQSWLVIYFEDGRVTRVERDVALDPSS